MLSNEQVAAARAELSKALILASEGIQLEMFSPAIDGVWHDLLSRPDEYVEFSISACGAVVGHSEGFTRGVVGFVESYERRWGALPVIWFCKKDGTLQGELLDNYQRHGTIEASWNCQATHNCLSPFRKDDRRDRTLPLPPPTGPKKKEDSNRGDSKK